MDAVAARVEARVAGKDVGKGKAKREGENRGGVCQKLKMRMLTLMLTPWHGWRLGTSSGDKMEVNMAKTVEMKTQEMAMEKMEVMSKRVLVEMVVQLQMESEVKLRLEILTEVHRHPLLLLLLFQQEREMVHTEIEKEELKQWLSRTVLENGNWLIS